MTLSNLLIRMENVSRRYIRKNSIVDALVGINIEIPQGKLIIFKGPSGSGKTTLLNIMAGLDTPSSGNVFFRGKNFKNISGKKLTLLRRKEIGIIFQGAALIEGFTAIENIEVPLRINKYHWKERSKLAQKALSIVGLMGRMNHHIKEMSGGEQQRVAIARALVLKPDIILADEPTAELDYKTSNVILALFKQIIEKYQTGICMVTHDPLALNYGDIVYELKDGKIVGEIFK